VGAAWLRLSAADGSEQAAGTLDSGLIRVRLIAFGLATLMLLHSALQRLRRTHRARITLPAGFSRWTAPPLDAVVTAADLPHAFPTPSPSSAWRAQAGAELDEHEQAGASIRW
jgi:hypothetical protein